MCPARQLPYLRGKMFSLLNIAPEHCPLGPRVRDMEPDIHPIGRDHRRHRRPKLRKMGLPAFQRVQQVQLYASLATLNCSLASGWKLHRLISSSQSQPQRRR